MTKAEAQDNTNNAADEIEAILEKYSVWIRPDHAESIIVETGFTDDKSSGLVESKVLTMPF